MTLALQCECGDIRGTIDAARAYARATCYCRDCQAYARHLGRPDVTDARGGTDIVAMDPAGVAFTQGVEHIACVSLSDKGILRWYAACCRSPLGNTPRDAKAAYVGLIASRVTPPAAVDKAFGRKGRIVLNASSASKPVSSTPVAFLLAGLRIGAGMARARWGKARLTPFFTEGGDPFRPVVVLDASRRAALGGND